MKSLNSNPKMSPAQYLLKSLGVLLLVVVLHMTELPAGAKSSEQDDSSKKSTASDGGRGRLTLPESPVIKGFHPIKRAMQPLQNLEGLAIKLQQQIINLEGPLAYIQPTMAKLRNQLTAMDSGLDSMEGQLQKMAVTVKGVRADVQDLEKEIHDLDGPIRALIVPVTNAATPMKAVNDKLTLVLIAVILAALAIAFGTPLFGILLYTKRHTLFPELFVSHSNHARDNSKKVQTNDTAH